MKLVVGYGNTLRRDDGVGWYVTDRIVPEACGGDLAVVQVHQLMPEIAAQVATADKVVFVDAAIVGQPGQIQVAPVYPAAQVGDAHSLTPPQILRLAQQLYERVPPVHLVTITGESFELGETLSPTVQAVVPQALRAIYALLSGLPGDHAGLPLR